MSGMQKVQQGVYPASSEGKRDAGHAAVCAPQSVFLQSYDGRDTGSHRTGAVSGIQKDKAGRLPGAAEIKIFLEKILSEPEKKLARNGVIVYNIH